MKDIGILQRAASLTDNLIYSSSVIEAGIFTFGSSGSEDSRHICVYLKTQLGCKQSLLVINFANHGVVSIITVINIHTQPRMKQLAQFKCLESKVTR